MTAYFKLALKNLVAHKFLSLLMVVAETVILFALGFCIYCDGVGNYGHNLLENTIYGGVDGGVIIESNESVAGDFDDDAFMQQELYNLEGIHGVGQYLISSISPDSIIDDASKEWLMTCIERQKNMDYASMGYTYERVEEYYSEELDVMPDEFMVADFTHYSLGLYRIKFLDWIDSDDLQYDPNTDYLLYLGWEYRDVPLGTVWYAQDGSKVIVAGHLKKNSKLFDISSILGIGASDSYKMELDGTGIIIYPITIYSGVGYYMYTVEEGYNREEVMKSVEELFASYGWEVHQYTLSNYEDVIFSQLSEIRERIGKQIPAFVLISVLAFLILQLLIVIKTTSKYGIYQLTGFREITIMGINLIEHSMQLIPAFLLAVLLICFMLSQLLLISSTTLMREIWTILSTQVFGGMFLIMLFMLMTGTIFPYLLHHKTSNAKLIKGDWR